MKSRSRDRRQARCYPFLGPFLDHINWNDSGLPDAPKEFDDLIADAMIKHGPDGHCDGHETIAALAWDWMKKHPKEDS